MSDKSIARKLLESIFQITQTFVVFGASFLVGLGAWHLSIFYLNYSLFLAVSYTLMVTSAFAMYLAIVLQKRMESKFGDSD